MSHNTVGGTCEDCGVYAWETSVVLVRNPKSEVLLVRQNYGHRFFGLPGGKIEIGEDPVSAAIRELREETGLDTGAVSAIGVHDLIYPGTGARYRAHAFSGSDVSGELAIQMPEEISSVGWFSMTGLPGPLTPSAIAVLAQIAAPPTGKQELGP